MITGNVRRVGIIGAGVAGLATAKTLLADGIDCVVFERGERLGGVWADGYSNFGVQIQKELYEFPDWSLPPEAPNFTPGPIFQQYLEGYCDHFGVRPHLRLNARVISVERRRGVHEVALGPQGVEAALKPERCISSKVAFENLTVVADLLDDPSGPGLSPRPEGSRRSAHDPSRTFPGICLVPATDAAWPASPSG